MQAFIKYLRVYYVATRGGDAEGDREFDRLSRDASRLTAQHPDIETIRGFFSDAGSKTGPQYR
ncbi:MAG: hypothetical protein JW384_00221 [Nitrosomonadaceae bacterium]|nr:hypothetical protein [Nitrosomonadaceae bacterium]